MTMSLLNAFFSHMHLNNKCMCMHVFNKKHVIVTEIYL